MSGGGVEMSWQLILPELEGRTALITGAASGLGLAIAGGLAQVGVSVVLADINEEELQTAVMSVGGDCQGLVLDVADSDAVSQAVAKHLPPRPRIINAPTVCTAEVGWNSIGFEM